MINDREIAKNISDLMLDIAGRLNESLREIQAECTEEEFKNYRHGVGYILGNISLEVLNKLYKKHPDLKPKDYYLPET